MAANYIDGFECEKLPVADVMCFGYYMCVFPGRRKIKDATDVLSKKSFLSSFV